MHILYKIHEAQKATWEYLLSLNGRVATEWVPHVQCERFDAAVIIAPQLLDPPAEQLLRHFVAAGLPTFVAIGEAHRTYIEKLGARWINNACYTYIRLDEQLRALAPKSAKSD